MTILTHGLGSGTLVLTAGRGQQRSTGPSVVFLAGNANVWTGQPRARSWGSARRARSWGGPPRGRSWKE